MVCIFALLEPSPKRDDVHKLWDHRLAQVHKILALCYEVIEDPMEKLTLYSINQWIFQDYNHTLEEFLAEEDFFASKFFYHARKFQSSNIYTEATSFLLCDILEEIEAYFRSEDPELLETINSVFPRNIDNKVTTNSGEYK